MNDAEKTVAEALRKAGWKVLSKGWPDLLVWNPDRRQGFAVELKSSKDRLSSEQREVHDVLTSFGIKVLTARYDEIGSILRKKGTKFLSPGIIKEARFQLEELQLQVSILQRRISEITSTFDDGLVVTSPTGRFMLTTYERAGLDPLPPGAETVLSLKDADTTGEVA